MLLLRKRSRCRDVPERAKRGRYVLSRMVWFGPGACVFASVSVCLRESACVYSFMCGCRCRRVEKSNHTTELCCPQRSMTHAPHARRKTRGWDAGIPARARPAHCPHFPSRATARNARAPAIRGLPSSYKVLRRSCPILSPPGLLDDLLLYIFYLVGYISCFLELGYADRYGECSVRSAELPQGTSTSNSLSLCG